MKAIKNKLIDVCIMVTITLVMVTGMEVAARIVRQVGNRFFLSTEASPEGAILLKHDWGRQQIVDSSELGEVHKTYVEFREQPYSSATIHVDSESRRRVPRSCETKPASTVLMFGGSTMFGAGVPDEFTIPAYFAEIVNVGGRCIKVVNYGASWWQSSQSAIQLIQELKRGAPPQAVVFYKGATLNAKTRQGHTPVDIAMGKAVVIQLPVPMESTVALLKKAGGLEGQNVK